MGAFEDFVASDAFFPAFAGLLILLVIVFFWILLSGRKSSKVKNQAADLVATKEQLDDELDEALATDLTEVVTSLGDIQVKDGNITAIENIEEIKEEKLEEIEVKKPKEDIILSVMDETPVEVYVPKEEFNDIGEAIEIEKTTPLIEENIPEDEQIFDIELPMMKKKEVDKDEIIELPLPKSLPIEIGEEAVTFDSSPNIDNELLAFSHGPIDDYEINENIEIEEEDTFHGERTEVFDLPELANFSEETETFDFPDFSNIEGVADDFIVSNVQKEDVPSSTYMKNIIKES